MGVCMIACLVCCLCMCVFAAVFGCLHVYVCGCAVMLLFVSLYMRVVCSFVCMCVLSCLCGLGVRMFACLFLC